MFPRLWPRLATKIASLETTWGLGVGMGVVDFCESFWVCELLWSFVRCRRVGGTIVGNRLTAKF